MQLLPRSAPRPNPSHSLNQVEAVVIYGGSLAKIIKFTHGFRWNSLSR